MAGKMDSETMMQQANSVWKMLNDLADSDPEMYKKFMDKTLKEGSEEFKPPQPCFCVSTVLLPQVITHKLYINVCGWQQVPVPKTDTDPIPVMAGAIQEITVDDSTHSVVDVIFNPKVLKDVEHKKDHRNLLVHLALDYLEEVKNFQVSRQYKTLKTKYKGNSSNLTKYLKPDAFRDQNHKSDSAHSYNKDQGGSKDTLLEQLSSIAVQDKDDIDVQGISLFDNKSSQSGKKGLIEEISSTIQEKQSNDIEVPRHEMIISNQSEQSFEQVVITVQLPKVSSVNQCELDVSENDVFLNVPSLYQLQIDLPRRVQDSKVTASFDKTEKVLIVKLPTSQ